MRQIMLKDNWKLREEPLSITKEQSAYVLSKEDGWMDCSVPCDVSMALIEAGKIKDPVVGENCYENEWIERRSWWFTKEFLLSQIPSCDTAELVFLSLDCHADIFFNGMYLGHQLSSHYPFRKDVKQWLKAGKNRIMVRLTVGLEHVSDQDLAEIDRAVCTERGNGCTDRSDKRRAFLRKPQYVFGWDWSPRIATCGIMDDVYLELNQKVAIRGLHLATEQAEEKEAAVSGQVELENLDPLETCDADVVVDISYEGVLIHSVNLEDQLLTSGYNRIPFSFVLLRPKLWWPNGYGSQPLYDVDVLVSVKGETIAKTSCKLGVRTVSLDTSRDAHGRRRFALMVNNREIFCKGANWIPADALYGRVSDQRFRTLVTEAANANFNMLRIWGGGLYNRDIFYRLCDEMGILLWHDFMFGCSTYPDHLDWFLRECEKEMYYQTRRLRNHPCMGLFCGNNENHQIFNWKENSFWGISITKDKQYGLRLANQTAKEIIWNNCPEIPFWNSSPYGGSDPGGQEEGDVHYWGQCMMNPDMSKRIEPKEYDKVTARFVSEYGYPGPTCLATMKEYLGQEEIDRGSRAWRLHTNTFEKDTVAEGIRKHYRDPENLSLEDYILYAGMVQSTQLGYSLESFRSKLSCFGGLFWMYNDCWGEVGWTIIDYSLRRKIAFYGVKRALEPVKIILRQKDDQVVAIGCNDTEKSIAFLAKIGHLSFDGSVCSVKEVPLVLQPGRNCIWQEKLPNFDSLRGVYAILPDSQELAPAVLRLHDIRQLAICGDCQVVKYEDQGEHLEVTVTAKQYTHGVYFETGAPCSDLYFDLLPGQEKTVVLYGAAGQRPELKWVK